jgi:SAM-dependent methyltransferase
MVDPAKVGRSSWPAQASTASFACRHDHIFAQLAACLRKAEFKQPKVLSFGCGSGFEPLDLLRYVGDADVFACDVSPQALKQASEQCAASGVNVFQSSAESLAARAPFDAIVAMNVLTRYPEAADYADISDIYPFEQFSRTLHVLISCLSRGGFLAVYNASYLVEDAASARILEPVFAQDIPQNGWIPKFTRFSKKMTHVSATYTGIKYTDVRAWRKAINLIHPKDSSCEQLPYSHALLSQNTPMPDLRTVIWRKA